MASLGLNNCRHSSWHTLVEVLEVLRGDPSPDLACDFFESVSICRLLFPLHVFHLRPKVFNWVKVRRVSGPALKVFHAVVRVPSLCRSGSVGRSPILHELKRIASSDIFSWKVKSGKLFLSFITSKVFELQGCASTRIVDRFEIFKKSTNFFTFRWRK